MKNIELLAPAGDLEKLKISIEYGADAVYFGGELFGLRAAAKNFTIDEIVEGVDFAHSKGKKAYLTLNIFAHNDDIDQLPNYLHSISHIPIDAVILSDPGVLSVVKEILPEMEIHLSTQANATNYRSAEFWHKQGIKRIVLARELSFEEIKTVEENTSEELDLEVFIHGAMCISYSGRCLLSNYMANRDANRGACAHPCRWKYYLVEEKRPGEYIPVSEDKQGTFFFNSKDLCTIEHIPALIDTGVVSLKIEGRMKSVFYAAVIVSTYRKAIDSYIKDPKNYEYKKEWLEDLEKVSHRNFTTGFNVDKPTEESQNYDSSSYIRNYDFVGLVIDIDENGYAVIEQRNKVSVGEEVEIFGPDQEPYKQIIEELLDESGNPIESAPHAKQIFKLKTSKETKINYMIRKKNCN